VVPTETGYRWLGNYVPYLVYRITSQLNRNLRKGLKRSGINITRWRVLAVLNDNGQMNMGQIVEKTIIEQSTVSRIVDQLEREGLARRQTSEEDSRIVEVALTRQGEKAFNEIFPMASKHQEQALQGFTSNEIEKLTHYLERIQNNITSEF
jgi:DNA-binding MarR family transcriptional regulator